MGLIDDIYYFTGGESLAHKRERKEGICSRCGGTGKYDESRYNENGEYEGSDTIPCPRCNGTGKRTWNWD